MILIAGYTLTQQSITGINGEAVTCGHLTCTEKSTLRLNDVLRESGDYYFQMKIKSKSASTVQLCIGTSVFNFSVTTSFIHFTQLCSNVNTAPHKYIELVFPSGEYWFYNLQLESGNIMTAWAFCMDDLKDELGTHSSWIEQTDQKLQKHLKVRSHRMILEITKQSNLQCLSKQTIGLQCTLPKRIMTDSIKR